MSNECSNLLKAVIKTSVMSLAALLMIQCSDDRPLIPMVDGNSHRGGDSEDTTDNAAQKAATAAAADQNAKVAAVNTPATPSPAPVASGNKQTTPTVGNAASSNSSLSDILSGLSKMGGSASAAAGNQPAAAGAGSQGAVTGDCIDGNANSCAAEFTLLVDTNAIRAEQNLPPLVIDPRMSWVARDWSKQQGMMISHMGFPQARKSSFEQRFPGESIPQFGAENVAYNGGGSSAAAVGSAFARQWKNSEGHYQNLIGNFRAVGLGIHCQRTNGTDGGSACTGTQIFLR